MVSPTANTESIRGEIGQGIYSLGDLRAFVAYDGSVQDGARTLEWLTEVLNPVAHVRNQTDYSFSDLVSLFVVRELRRHGVRPAKIRRAEEYLRARWNTDRPFVSDRIKTDGHEVYANDELAAAKPEQIEAASLGGQHAMLEPIRDHLRTVRYDHGSASQWVPVTHVIVDPRVQFGDPVIRGTRVPTAEVATAATTVGAKQAAVVYDVAPEAVKSAVRFEERLAELRG
jgi:uncharacterized protein (DUF433 family)